MALFENFPYTNLHDLNLDWVLSTVRKLIAEWIAYQEAMNKNFKDLSDKFDDLYDYVQNYFNNLDLETEIANAVNDVLQEMIEDGTLEAMISDYIKSMGSAGSVAVNTLIEYLSDINQTVDSFEASDKYEHSPQGMCYIGNGQVLQYIRYTPDADDKGKLICIDLESGTVLWKNSALVMYHGNSLAYKDGYVYVAAGLNNSNTPVRKVFKLSVAAHASDILDTFSDLPGTNVAIDDVTGYFYSVGGVAGGNPNKIYRYLDDFTLPEGETEPEEITLESTYQTSELFHSNSQGCCVHNNIAFLLYDMTVQVVAAFDLNTGKLLNMWNVPYIWNKCLYNQEIEDITYDPDKDRYLLSGAALTQRLHNCPKVQIAEIGLYKPVAVRVPRYVSYDAANTPVNIYVDTGSTQVQQSGECKMFIDRWYDGAANLPVFYSAYDAELYAALRGVDGFMRYVAFDHVTHYPIFSTWRPHTNFSIMQVSDPQNKLRLSAPVFTRCTEVLIKGTSGHNIQIYGGRAGSSGHAVLGVNFLTHVTLSYVELQPSLDDTAYGIEVYDNGKLTLLNYVDFAPGVTLQTLLRVLTGGIIDNCKQILDDTVTVGTAKGFDFVCTTIGQIMVAMQIANTDTEYLCFSCDRAASNKFKVLLPYTGGYIRCNIEFSSTSIKISSMVFYEDGASSGSAISTINRVVVTQYPNVAKFARL